MENKFSTILKDLREEKGLSQRDLAKKLKVSNVSVSNWEKDLKKPQYENIKLIAEYFGVSCDYLMGNEN